MNKTNKILVLLLAVVSARFSKSNVNETRSMSDLGGCSDTTDMINTMAIKLSTPAIKDVMNHEIIDMSLKHVAHFFSSFVADDAEIPAE